MFFLAPLSAFSKIIDLYSRTAEMAVTSNDKKKKDKMMTMMMDGIMMRMRSVMASLVLV
jgi:hypothetical protein